VSRTTLNVWGGVPREISEKSGASKQLSHVARELPRTAKLTLGVQEVADGHRVAAVGDVGCFEDLLHVRLRLDAHVLLAERSSLLLDVGVLLSRVLDCRCRVMHQMRQMGHGLQAAPTKEPSSAACGACQQWRQRPRPRVPSPSSC